MNKQQYIGDVIAKAFRDYSSPNSGGCGLFAYALARALDSKGINNKIYLFSWSDYDLECFQKEVNRTFKHSCQSAIIDWVRMGNNRVSIHSHIAVKVGNAFYDAEGIYEPHGTKFYLGMKALRALLESPTWNRTFKCHNPEYKTDKTYIAKRAERLVNNRLSKII